MPVVNYVWDVVSDNVLMEIDDEGNTITRYVQEPELYGEAISQERDGQVRYYNYDGLGNTSELTDENQNVTDTYEYSAFGEEVARTGTTENPFRYKGALGYYTDVETEGVYVRARTYQPSLARWLSQDPIEIPAVGDLYTYVYNSPISATDPSGLLTVVHGGQTRNPACGKKVSVFWDFFVDLPVNPKNPDSRRGAPCDGFIVQHVEVVCVVNTCGPCGCKEATFENCEYWEAWFVSQGKRQSTLRKSGNHTDEASANPKNETCGAYGQKGEIIFYLQ